MLVEEAKVGGTQCLGCPCVDQDLRLLAEVAKPASVTVCEDSHVSPCAGGTLSSSDLVGRLFPVVPAGIPFPVGPVGTVGQHGTLCPSDSEHVGLDGLYAGPVGQCGTQSPSDSEPVGPDGLYMLALSDSEPVGPDGPYVAPSESEPVGPYVGPSDSEPVGPDGPYVGPCGMLSPFDLEPVGPNVGPCGTLSPCDS